MTISIFSILCLLPFIVIISGSLTANDSIIREGYHLFPKVLSFEGYSTIFVFPEQILKAYGVTTFCTVAGSIAGLFFISMAGYVLQRKDFKYRNPIAFYAYFTTLFGGGLVPWYILLSNYLHFKNTFMALIFPQLMNPFLIILMKNFIKSSVPDELSESAKIDGANDWIIYLRVVLPISLPGLATIGLFLALGYWNDWFLSSIFITKPEMFELQYYLYQIMSNMNFMATMATSGVSISQNMPMETTRMAMAVVATGPIFLLYPFVQRYFVKGLTVGAVKG